MKSMLSQQTLVRSLLKMRPMAIALLDKREIRYWDSLDKPLGDLVGRDGMEDFLDDVSNARVPASDTDWSAMPLYMLVDFLTHEHRDFLLQEISDINHLLDIYTISDSPESADLRKIQTSFKTWVGHFQTHIEEEEGNLFPKVLRYEACLRDRNVHPEFHRGSIQSYMASREARESSHFYGYCGELADSMRAHELTHPGSIAARELSELTERLRDKFNAHTELESTALYTAARELERNLYNKSIDGDPAVAFQRPGPMDSGILRLDLG
ncbi:MAG: hypothetical protein M3Y08_04870 [Fibrobacterota bacterium]|nr:hypothetical protein [Fibrobacterota bacterium]